MIRADLVDPSAFTPPYDHALAAALAREGVEVRVVTSSFPYGSVPAPEGYAVREDFYRHARGPAGSWPRRALKLAEHVPDMLRYRQTALDADIVHFQWLTVPVLDARLLPARSLVVTAHDLLPREPAPGQLRAQRRLLARADAVIVHSRHGRAVLEDELGIDPERLHVIHHGAFHHLVSPREPLPLDPALGSPEGLVVLYFGLIRPYKGLDVLLDAWRGVEGAELWVVGRPRMDISELRAKAPSSVRFLTRFVEDAELPALFGAADVVVLPYTRTDRFDQSGVLATALAFGKAIVMSDVGGFGEVAETGAGRLVPPGDAEALRVALAGLVSDPAARGRLERAALTAAEGPLSWREAARATRRLYETILRS